MTNPTPKDPTDGVTLRWIRDAQEGGYAYKREGDVYTDPLLDRDAWIAVGKTRGWEPKCYICQATESEGHSSVCSKMGWSEEYDHGTPRYLAKEFMNEVFNGHTIESALSQIE